MTKRYPRRRRQPDRPVVPHATPTEIEIDHIVATFDAKATEMERKWGIDRLPTLVSPETAGRWGKQMDYLNHCIGTNDTNLVRDAVEGSIRGLAALDREAEANGATRHPEIWEYDDGQGFRFGVMPDDYQWHAAKKARPDLMLFTMREISLALKGISGDGILDEVKKRFPGAQISAVRPQVAHPIPPGGDPIPFAPERRV